MKNPSNYTLPTCHMLDKELQKAGTSFLAKSLRKLKVFKSVRKSSLNDPLIIIVDKKRRPKGSHAEGRHAEAVIDCTDPKDPVMTTRYPEVVHLREILGKLSDGEVVNVIYKAFE